MENTPFISTHSGNCITCNTLKPLDSMLRKNYKKEYECIDCKVEDENLKNKGFEAYKEHKQTIESVLNDENVPVSKLRSLIKWCFG